MEPAAAYCSERLPNTRFVCCEGTVKLDGHGALGWFEPPADDDRGLDGPNPPMLNGLSASVLNVHSQMSQLLEEPIDPSDLHLLGHSQGGAIALAAGLTYSQTIGSVCTIAGYLALTPEMVPAETKTTFHLHHSNDDDNVTVRWAYYARERIQKWGHPCTLRCWDVDLNPHGIHPCQLDAICKAIDEHP